MIKKWLQGVKDWLIRRFTKRITAMYYRLQVLIGREWDANQKKALVDDIIARLILLNDRWDEGHSWYGSEGNRPVEVCNPTVVLESCFKCGVIHRHTLSMSEGLTTIQYHKACSPGAVRLKRARCLSRVPSGSRGRFDKELNR